MPKFTKELVDDLANKLLIGLSDEENQRVLAEFAEIDKNIKVLIRYPFDMATRLIGMKVGKM